jgi:hypothetical protein
MGRNGWHWYERGIKKMTEKLTEQKTFGPAWPATWENLERLSRSLIVPPEKVAAFEAHIDRLYEEAHNPAWSWSDREHRSRQLTALDSALPHLGLHLDLKTGRLTMT